MRIDVLSREYPPEVYGGAGVHVAELVRALRAVDGVDTRVHCFGGERQEAGTTAYAECPLVVASDERPHSGTLGELGAEAIQVAAWLQSLGVGRGDVVALQLPNWWEGAVLQAATTCIERPVSPRTSNTPEGSVYC